MKITNRFHNNWDKLFSIILIIIAIVYDISPADVIPDIIPFAGLFDDFFVTLLIIINIFLKWRKKK